MKLLIVALCGIAIVASSGSTVGSAVTETCAECIMRGPNYAWCGHDGFTLNRSRCDTDFHLESAGCPKDKISDPILEYELYDRQNVLIANPKQIFFSHPHRLELKMRPFTKHEIRLQYKNNPNDYFIDFYKLNYGCFDTACLGDNFKDYLPPKERNRYNMLYSHSHPLKIVDNATSGFKITYYSDCNSGQKRETNSCPGAFSNSNIEFAIIIEAESCPDQVGNYIQNIQIKPSGVEGDTLHLDLKLICECDCEKPSNIQKNSRKCAGKGDLVCGQCVCHANAHGDRCECPSENYISDSHCHKGSDKEPCSGRGRCLCGTCKCYQQKGDLKVWGEHCECDNFNSPQHDNKTCSGNDHGTCIDPKSGKICAGHGECISGECKCTKTQEKQYTGKYCEKFPNRPTICEQFKDCVMCKVFKTGPLVKDDQCRFCTNGTFDITDGLFSYTWDSFDGATCRIVDDDGCEINFKYKRETFPNLEQTNIFVRTPNKCPIKSSNEDIYAMIGLTVYYLSLIMCFVGLFYRARSRKAQWAKSSEQPEQPPTSVISDEPNPETSDQQRGDAHDVTDNASIQNKPPNYQESNIPSK